METGSPERNRHKTSKSSARLAQLISSSDRKRARDPDPESTHKVKRFRKKKSYGEHDEAEKEKKKKKKKEKKEKKEKKKKDKHKESGKASEEATAVKRKHVPEDKAKTRTKKSNDGLLPILDAQYELKYVVKGHADRTLQQTRELEDDEDVNLWACEFEPEQDSDVVAICGANNVLFLDAQKGTFVKKYTHPEAKEEFLCLAWTKLRGPSDLMDDDAAEDDICTILATAGRLGSVKLINYIQNECYRYLFGHQRQIHRMLFHKNYKRWLFTASDDMSIRLWDIGSPAKERKGSICLGKFAVPASASVPASMSMAPDNTYLMVGCTDGHMLRYNISRQTMLALEDRSKDEKQPMQTLRPNILYPDGDEWHDGYIDDIYVLGQTSAEAKHKLDGCIVSRGTDDYETIVWNPETSTLEDADILLSFEWPDSDGYSGTRFKVIEQNGKKAMVAGDYEGHIRIFDIGDTPFSKTLEDNSKEQHPEKKLLSHSLSRRLVRDVSCSSDTSILVSVNSGNDIFVWHEK